MPCGLCRRPLSLQWKTSKNKKGSEVYHISLLTQVTNVWQNYIYCILYANVHTYLFHAPRTYCTRGFCTRRTRDAGTVLDPLYRDPCTDEVTIPAFSLLSLLPPTSSIVTQHMGTSMGKDTGYGLQYVHPLTHGCAHNANYISKHWACIPFKCKKNLKTKKKKNTHTFINNLHT